MSEIASSLSHEGKTASPERPPRVGGGLEYGRETTRREKWLTYAAPMTIEMKYPKGIVMHSFACPSKWLALTLSPEALITSLSSGVEQFIGYSSKELVGRPVTSILVDQSVFELPGILTAVRDWGYWEGEIVLKARDGSPLHARAAFSSLSGAGNRSAGCLMLSMLEEPSAVNGKGGAEIVRVSRTLRALAHDMNNPLAVIMGLTQLMMLSGEYQGKAKGDLEKLHAELKRVILILEKLHGYAVSLDKEPGENEGSSDAAQLA